jgi:hypothetical protein
VIGGETRIERESKHAGFAAWDFGGVVERSQYSPVLNDAEPAQLLGEEEPSVRCPGESPWDGKPTCHYFGLEFYRRGAATVTCIASAAARIADGGSGSTATGQEECSAQYEEENSQNAFASSLKSKNRIVDRTGTHASTTMTNLRIVMRNGSEILPWISVKS